jgi:hypothetical protein
VVPSLGYSVHCTVGIDSLQTYTYVPFLKNIFCSIIVQACQHLLVLMGCSEQNNMRLGHTIY